MLVPFNAKVIEITLLCSSCKCLTSQIMSCELN